MARHKIKENLSTITALNRVCRKKLPRWALSFGEQAEH